MKNYAVFALGLAALVLASPSKAAFEVSVGAPVQGVPAGNDFNADLAGLGLVSYTSTGATVTTTGLGRVEFSLVAAESGFADGFTVLGSGITLEGNEGWSLLRSPFAVKAYGAGLLAAAEWFFTSGGAGGTAGIGDAGFGIFLPTGVAAGDVFKSGVLFFGFDDQLGRTDDDNHDDFIIRAAFVPEPATWAMMISGFGLVGASLRRQRRAGATVSA